MHFKGARTERSSMRGGGSMPAGASKANRHSKEDALQMVVRPLRALGLAMTVLFGCAALDPSFAASSPPVAVGARLGDEGGPAKLPFELSSAIEASAFSMVDPDRIIIDIPEVNFQIDP